mmetsp:Transcript_155222/g.497886  ORF Transcript_155222/g.497886 Transcript_155222/m.497886 type:complete len:212 (+) Transcript_155222:2643-3278(+)
MAMRWASIGSAVFSSLTVIGKMSVAPSGTGNSSPFLSFRKSPPFTCNPVPFEEESLATSWAPPDGEDTSLSSRWFQETPVNSLMGTFPFGFRPILIDPLEAEPSRNWNSLEELSPFPVAMACSPGSNVTATPGWLGIVSLAPALPAAQRSCRLAAGGRPLLDAGPLMGVLPWPACTAAAAAALGFRRCRSARGGLQRPSPGPARAARALSP